MAARNYRVLVVGCGNMGSSHARAYKKLDGFELAALVNKPLVAAEKLAAELGGVPCFESFDEAMKATKPDAVSINTYPDTHAEFAEKAFKAGAHVFLEKPIATTVADAQRVVSLFRGTDRKLVIGYILRHHPAWIKFIEMAHTLGKPLVMRMNLNQQSSGPQWKTHKGILQSMSPIVDCGVHYVDVMCQMTRSRPVSVSAIGARLNEDLVQGMYNYGQLQVRFEDGSVGWYEAAYGPSVSQAAYFTKDVFGPKGSVSIVAGFDENKTGQSADIDSHSKTNCLRVHYGELGADGNFARQDERVSTADEPDHQGLCDREQAFFLQAMRENMDLNDHWDDAVNSLRIVLAADQSVRTGKMVELNGK